MTARASASTLGQVADTASPGVSADGTLGFDAAWASQAIMTAHWTSTTRKWSKAVALSTTGFGGSSVKVAGAPSGAAAVIWASNGHIGRLLTVVDARYRASANSPWQRSGTLLASRAEAVTSPQLGIDRHGDAFALWGTVDGAIDMAEHPAGAGSWSPTVTIVREPHGPGIGTSELAVSPTGTLALVWEHYLTGTTMTATTFRLYLKIKPAGQSSWLPTLKLGIEGLFPAQNDITVSLPGPRIAINAHNTVFVTWQWPHNNTFYPRAAILDPASDWRKPRVATLRKPGADPVIAPEDRGFATVLWRGAHPSTSAQATKCKSRSPPTAPDK